MANNFEAIVRAVLDQQQFDTDMNKLQNAKYELRNIHIEPSNLAKEIQNALDSQRFNVDINPVINVGGSGNSGKNLAKAVETAINTGIGSNSVTVNLKDALQFKGVDSKVADSIIKSVSKDIDSATIKLKSFDAQFEETIKNGRQLQSIRFVGIDEDGKTLNILSKIDKKTGEVASTVTHVTQKFDVATGSVNKTCEAFDRLVGLQTQMGSKQVEILKLDPNKNAQEIAELQRQLESLNNEYNELFNKNSSNFSTDQFTQLSVSLDKILQTKAHIEDSIKLKIDTGKLDSDLSNITAKFNQLKSSATNLDPSIQSNLERMRQLLKDMSNQTGSELVQSYSEFNKILDTTKNKLGIVADANKETVSDLQVLTLSNKMQTWLDKNTKASKDYGEAIAILKSRLDEASKSGKVSKEVYNEVDQEFKKIQQSAISAGKAGQSLGDKLKRAFSGVFGVISVASVLRETVNVLKDMYQEVYEIDTAMVSLKKVTDETDSRYNTFLKDAAASAKELGRSISSLAEQSSAWAKLGYSIDQAEELAKLSSIYANVAEVDDETAVSDIVTALKAFKMETDEAERVVDSLNELGNRFATDAASLGQGLSNSASAMSVAGADMYETLAMITGITEITQDASGAGNALKIGSMRIRGMKGELEDLGEEVDETVDSISKVQTQILNLTHGKVNIFDDAGEFRDYYKIMEEIAAIYKDLTSTEQASLSELLFGKNRGNQGAALIQSFQSGQIQKAYETAVNSAGSAAKEQARWMESLEAKTQQFKAAYQELSMTVLDSDFLKGLVDTGTNLLEILTAIIDKLGVIPTLLTAGGIAGFVKNLD